MNDERRFELNELNQRAWTGEEVFPLKSKKLDSSIKKNTGFIKKLKKGFAKENKDGLLKDIGEISLEKYLSEVITTIYDVTSNISNKNDEIITAVEIISAVHQRFNARFTVNFFELFLSNFINPVDDKDSEKEEPFRINKLKGNLRLITELYLVGVCTSLDIVESKENIPFYLQRKINRKEPYIFSILKEILNYKFKSGNTTSIGTMFVKRYPLLFDDDDEPWSNLITDNNLKTLLQSLFKAFSEAVMSRMVELNKIITKLMKEHQKCQIRTGKLSDEYIEEHDELLPIFEKFNSAAGIFAEAFNLSLPELNSGNEAIEEEKPTSVVVTQLPTPSQKLFDSEETRKFYEILPDIQDLFNKSTRNNDSASNNSDPNNINEFFSKLELAETKDEIDVLSNQYWIIQLDNKATRNRLLKFLIETQDWSKIRIYARFIATNSKYMPEITEEFIKYLDNGFRSQLHSNKINVKNIIFYSEMIKFMLVPIFMIFHKIRTLTINLQVPNNIEILTIFFEHSSKFLLNKGEYKEHMDKMVLLLKSKMKETQLTMNFKSALDNILMILFPPSVKSLNEVERKLSPEEHFYKVLIRRELSNLDFKQSLILLRKANWSNKDVYNTLFLLFSEPEKISYQNLPLLTKILSGLYIYQRNFVIQVIDQVLENILRGLEINEFSENIQRVTQVRYITEIFNLEMIKSSVLLDIVYQIIRYGHFRNNPNPMHLNEEDLPDNYFRIQLVTTILLSIRRFPTTLTKQLELLLRFFEYYTFTKQQPLPKETQFRIEETIAAFSDVIALDRSDNLIESAKRFQSFLESSNDNSTSQSTQIKNGEEGKTKDISFVSSNSQQNNIVENEEDDEDEDDEDNDEGLLLDDDEYNQYSSKNVSDENVVEDEDEDEDDEGSSSSSNSSSDSDTSVSDDDDDDDDDDVNFRDIDVDRNTELKRMQDEYESKLKSEEERKIEEELEKQFQQVMIDSLEERKSDKVGASNMPIISSSGSKPVILKKQSATDAGGSAKPKVAFTFLTKSGKKTNSRTLQLPTNVKFVSDVLEQEEKMKDEKERIKKIVLQRSFD